MESIIIFILLISAAILFAKASESFRFPGTIIIVVFALLYIWNKWGILKFYKTFELTHAIYLISCLLLFSLAALMSTKVAKRNHVSSDRIALINSYVEKRSRLLVVVGIIGGLLMLYDIRGSIVGSSISADNFNDIRTVYTERTSGFLSQIGSILFGTALPGLILGMRQWLRKEKYSFRIDSILLIMLIATMFGVSFSSGGRQAIIEVIMTFVAILLYGGMRSFNIKRLKWFVLASSAVFIFGTLYMTTVASQRAEYGNAGESFLLSLWDAEYSGWYSPLANELSSNVTLPLLAMHGYFPYNLTGLSAVLDGTEKHGWGELQGVHLLRQLSKLGLEWPFVGTLDTRYDLNNYNWTTIYGAMYLDFGLIGTFIAITMLGWYSGKQFGRYVYFDITSAYLFTSIGFVFIFHSTMYSPFQESLLLYGLIWSIVLHVRSIFVKNRSIVTLNRIISCL